MTEVDANKLFQRLDALEAKVAKLEEERDAYHDLYLEMLEKCRKLERGLLGQKAERLPPNEAQMSLAMMGMLLTNDEAVPEGEGDDGKQQVQPHERNKPKRKPLPENLPRVDVVVLPHEVERQGLDAFEQIGQEVAETLERRPSSVVVVRTFKPKYVRKDRNKKGEGKTEVFVAKAHPLPIPRGLAGPGMLADSIVKRWDDHLPLNRLERVYGRDGVQLARTPLPTSAQTRPAYWSKQKRNAGQGTSGCSSYRDGTCCSNSASGTTARPSTRCSPITTGISWRTRMPSTTTSTSTDRSLK